MVTAVKGKQLEYSNFISSNMVIYCHYRLDTFYTTVLMLEVRSPLCNPSNWRRIQQPAVDLGIATRLLRRGSILISS